MKKTDIFIVATFAIACFLLDWSWNGVKIFITGGVLGGWICTRLFKK